MKIIVANWKNYVQDYKSAKKLFEFYKSASAHKKDLFLIIAPGEVFLKSLSDLYKGKKISFCAQEVASRIPDTGKTSLIQAKDAGAEFFITGHSEQRARGKADSEINEEILQSIKQKIYPILVVGEERRSEDASHFKFVAKQIKGALKNYPKNKPADLMVAYEPVWAVGTGTSAKLNDIETMALYIKKTLVSALGDRRGRKVPILYGGSLNKNSLPAVFDIEYIDGVVVGGASVDKDELKEIFDKI